MKNPLKILLYNYLQPEEGGGGVGVYSANLAASLKNAGHHVITLSSGDVYTLVGRSPKLKVWTDRFDRAVITNSPMIAPSFDAWDSYDTYNESSALDGMPRQIRERFGEVDVFHFQNVEGLTRSFFEALRAAYPEAVFVYSMHNYNSVCAQVDLWYQERQSCTDYRDGQNCTRCFPQRKSSVDFRRARRWRPLKRWSLKVAPGLFAARRALRARLRGAGGAEGAGDAFQGARMRNDGTVFRRYREANARLLATTFDHVLAVSQRTKQVAEQRGVDAANVSVSYIGTKHKAIYESARKITSRGERLHVAYLGYMRRSKGYDLFLDALERLPEDVARAMTVTVAAKKGDSPAGYERLTALGPRLGELRYFDGFTHKTLGAVLSGVNLGVVPPIWEDNLPQVAIEMVARGIPVLTSDRGGAQEIAGVPDFIFEGGSAASLAARLEGIASGGIPLAKFWSREIRMFSMEEHVAELVGTYYRSGRRGGTGDAPRPAIPLGADAAPARRSA